MDRGAHRATLAFALAIAAIGGVPSSAGASVLSLVPNDGAPGYQMIYAAAPGERNAITVSESGGAVTISDSAVTFSAPAGCAQDDAHSVTCRSPAGPLTFGAALDDGDDSAVASASQHGVTIIGGSGNDVLVGGPGNDHLDGDVGDDVLIGAGGDDQLLPETGRDVIDGGAGTDTAQYGGHGTPITVDLGALSADGGADPADTLRSVESVEGTSGADVITGDDGANTLDGAAGADRLRGGGGADRLVGGAGRDRIDGGDGDDVVDLSLSDSGDVPDVPLPSVDGQADRVQCGSGRDLVLLPDVEDRLDPDCELVAFELIVLRTAPIRVTRHQVVVRVASVLKPRRQRIWLTIKRGGHTRLLGRSALRRRAGDAHIRLNSTGRRLFADGRSHLIRIGDGLDPDAALVTTVGPRSG